MCDRRFFLWVSFILVAVSACSGDSVGLDDDYPNVRGTWLVTSGFKIERNTCGFTAADLEELSLFLGSETKLYVAQEGKNIQIGNNDAIVLEKDGSFKSFEDTETGREYFYSSGGGTWINYVMRSWSEGKFSGEQMMLKIVVRFQFERSAPGIGNGCELVAGLTARRVSTEFVP